MSVEKSYSWLPTNVLDRKWPFVTMEILDVDINTIAHDIKWLFVTIENLVVDVTTANAVVIRVCTVGCRVINK